MDKGANPDQGSSSAGESPAGALESQQPRADSMGDEGLFFVGSLPAEVVRRVNALRNLQYEHHKIEASFFEEVHALECRYLTKYQTLYDKRTNIVKGTYEPTDEEAKCAFDEDPEDPTAKKETEEKKTDEQTKSEGAVGIPEFWLQVLKNSDVVSEIIREHDEPVLKHLIDVRLKMQNETDQKGFTIEFEFTPNDFFTNTILTKSYKLRTGPDEHEPLAYEGPEIIKSEGSTIDWKKGKNVTVKMVKKRQKHKNRGTIRVVTKEVQTESFFNFFSPPVVPEDPEADVEDNDEMQMLAQDFEIGHLLRDSIIPKAVLYFTGEAGDEDDDDYDEDEDEDDEDDDDDDDDDHDDDYDEDEDEDDEDDDDDDDDDHDDDDDDEGGHHHHGSGRGGGHHHGKHGAGGKSRGGGKHGGAGGAAGQQPECKQQ